MKISKILIGIILFTGLVSLFFNISGSLGEEYQSRDYQDYQTLSNNYETYADIGSDDDKAVRSIWDKLEDVQIIGTGVEITKAAAEGTKLILGSIGIVENVYDTTANEVQLEQSNLIRKILISIFTVIFVLAILYMFMKFKAEA